MRRGAVLAGLALAATILLFVLAAWRRERPPLTFLIGGSVERGVVGAFLAAPAAADLPVTFSDGTTVQIAAGARARIAEVSPRGARVLVESGVVRANVIHRNDTRWLVDAGPFEVRVTGTRFDVAWDPADQAIVVTLHEGSVVVTGCTLADGQRVSSGQQLRASCKDGTSKTALLDGLPASSPFAATPAEPAATAAASLPDAPRAPSTEVHATPTASGPASSAPAPLASGTASAASPVALPTASELLARANAERYAGRFDAAVESLDLVRRRFKGSDASAAAAFELGRIAFDARRDFVEAGDWFDTYLRERPSGALAREALGRAIESRHRAGDALRAEKLASRYIVAYPDGPHSALARRLTINAGGAP